MEILMVILGAFIVFMFFFWFIPMVIGLTIAVLAMLFAKLTGRWDEFSEKSAGVLLAMEEDNAKREEEQRLRRVK